MREIEWIRKEEPHDREWEFNDLIELKLVERIEWNQELNVVIGWNSIIMNNGWLTMIMWVQENVIQWQRGWVMNTWMDWKNMSKWWRRDTKRILWERKCLDWLIVWRVLWTVINMNGWEKFILWFELRDQVSSKHIRVIESRNSLWNESTKALDGFIVKIFEICVCFVLKSTISHHWIHRPHIMKHYAFSNSTFILLDYFLFRDHSYTSFHFY